MGHFRQFFAILTPLDPLDPLSNPCLRERTGSGGPFGHKNKNFDSGIFRKIVKNPQKWAKFGRNWRFLKIFRSEIFQNRSKSVLKCLFVVFDHVLTL